MSEHTQTEWPADWPISACEWADQREETIEKLHGDIDRLRTRLARYERDLFDERAGENRSQDTEWLRRGFLQRGAEIERLEEECERLRAEKDAAHDKGKAEGIRAGWNAGYAQGHNDANKDRGHAQIYTLSDEDILQAAESMKREALASAPAVSSNDESDETPVWVIVNKPGSIPFRKRPIQQTNEAVAELLIALYENHPDATCTVLYMQPHGPEPESGREWLSIHSAAASTDGREYE